MVTSEGAAGGASRSDERTHVLALLRRHGWNATSFQTIEAGFRYFFDGPDACTAYVDTGAAWVAAGAPIGTPRSFGGLAQRFLAEASRNGRRGLFFATEDRFVARAGLRALLVGEQPVWDPAQWSATLATSSSLRAQLRRARGNGVTVRQIAASDVADPTGDLRRQIEALIARWLAARALAAMGFLVDVQPFSNAGERRYFIAQKDGRLAGFLAAVPVYARRGWLFEDLLRAPEAPNGTVESLIDCAMRSVAAEGSRFVTLGLAPLAGSVNGWLGIARRMAGSLYDFSGLRRFRAKLRPTRWDPIYVSFPAPRSAVLGAFADGRAIHDVLAAFARGRLVGFGLETLLRGPAFVLRLLGALLMPWTAALAVAPARFFPNPAVRWAWVSFDVMLALALLSLAARWRRSLGVVVAATVSIDAVMTVVQAALYNLPAVAHVGDGVSIGVAVAMPIMAAAILWKAVGHRRARR